MGKKTKIGKQRKDRFYQLAKETGYRSRASFKLIQLNRKFEFLSKSRVIIDLCAAPGGWLQVAQQAMPVSSVIVGVDLVSIRPIPNVITLQEDITTESCRQALKKELKTWKADVVLHDGAPNVGKNWIQDAFTQNGLVLSALKLASEMLVKGGWFITKVFRSKDYLSLVWVFKKLFKQVHITKPQASRNESAEIFVVCQGYMAPDRIDPKFLDPSHIFKDVKNKTESKTNILKVSTKKAKAEGYDEDEPLYSTLKASDFLFCDNHVERLGKCGVIEFDDNDIKNHTLTTDEVRQCCADIKVLGKADFKLLLNWRKQMLESIKKAEKAGTKEDVENVIEENAEEKEIEDALKEAEDIELEHLQAARRKEKRILKERRKTMNRINLKMIIKNDEPIIQEDRELFSFSQIRNQKDLSQIGEDDVEFDNDQDENDLDLLTRGHYKKNFVSYDRDVKDDYGRLNLTAAEEVDYSSDDGLSSEMEFESESEAEEDREVESAVLSGPQNPLEVDLVERPERVDHTTKWWFDREEFAGDGEESDLEMDLLAEEHEKGAEKEDASEEDKLKSDSAKVSKDAKKKKKEEKKKDKKRKLTSKGFALGSLIVQSKKFKRDLIEDGYNRFANFEDENLPHWFVQDEIKNYRKPLPVTYGMISEEKNRLKQLNVRPVKRVVEAKARKKKIAMRRLEKAKKRAEKITDQQDMSEKEKVDHLKQIYKKALPKEDKKVTYIVAKRGAGKKVHRPAGVKGRFKVVDPRMKKDDRQMKTRSKSDKKHVRKSAKQQGAKQQQKKNRDSGHVRKNIQAGKMGKRHRKRERRSNK